MLYLNTDMRPSSVENQDKAVTLPVRKPAVVLGMLLLLGSVLSQISGFDLIVSSRIYALFDGAFPRTDWLLQVVLHDDARRVFIGIAAILVIVAMRPVLFRSNADWHLKLRLFVVSGLLFMGSVSLMKALTTFPCPWSLEMFGGTKLLPPHYTDIFDLGHYGHGRCFPAGHSSSGYIWLGLGFVFAGHRPDWFRYVLAALPLGLVFSVTQILRGAHFLSHELATMGFAFIVFATLPSLLLKAAESISLRKAQNSAV